MLTCFHRLNLARFSWGRVARRATLVFLLCGLVGYGQSLAHATTLTVTSTADDGSPSTLRSQIEAASPGDTLNCTVTGTITLAGSRLAVSKDLTINGPGASSLTISGNHLYQVIAISSGANVTLSGLGIRNGSVTSNPNPNSSGGGIFNAGTLTVKNCTIADNSITGLSALGGGIYNSGTLTINDSVISGNSASSGGGIYSLATINDSGTVAISNSTLSGNSAANGGGIYSSTGTLTMTGSSISNNSASSGDGAGIFNNATFSITNSVMSNNTAHRYGGALCNSRTMTVTKSAINGNSGGSGGGIYNTKALTITASTLSGNSGAGGGICGSNSTTNLTTITNTTISGNTSPTSGGGIFNMSGSFEITNSTIANNTSASNGGGITNRGKIVINNGTVSGNTCTVAGGGGGGGIYNDANTSYTIQASNSIIAGNSGGNLQNAGTFDNQGYNLLSGDPKLGPLQDNGGPTLTMAPLAGSPAIDAGNTSLTTDQRGLARPYDNSSVANASNGNGSDIGAVEVQAAPTDTTAPSVAITAPTNGVSITSLPAISGTASDNTGGSGLARIDLYLRRDRDGKWWTGTAWGTTTPTPFPAVITNGTWTRNSSLPSTGTTDDNKLLSVGTYAIGAYAYDNANNVKTVSSAFTVPSDPSQLWQATDLAVGGDNLARLLWIRPDKAFAVWTLSASGDITSTPLYGPISGIGATAIGAGGSDLKSRILLNSTDGKGIVWTVQNAASGNITSTPAYGPISAFTCREIATAPDNTTRLLWVRSDGGFVVWTVNADGNFTSTPLFGPIGGGWSANAISVGADNKTTILINNTDGRAAVWTVQNASTGNITSTPAFGPITGFTCRDLATGSDNKTRMLWVRTDGAFAVWTTDAAGNFTSTSLLGPIAGWNEYKVAVGADLKARVLLNNGDGRAAVWTIDGSGNFTSTPAYGPIAFTG